MRVVIINNPDTYIERVNFVFDYFSSLGHEVFIIGSDFSHIRKEKVIEKKENRISIKTIPYSKNISFRRIVSLLLFSRSAVKHAGTLKPDFLYVLIPPNSLAMYAGKYKKRHSNIKLVFDLMDVWPESFPLTNVKNLVPFKIWSKLRDKNLVTADFVISECDLFKEVISEALPKRNGTLYLTIDESLGISSYPSSMEKIHLCYLGTINSIIDIEGIRKLIQLIQNLKPVVVHLIGDGESKVDFVANIMKTGAEVIDYGQVFDAEMKQEIFGKCHFGLNMMKNSVKVGLTTKSLNYFSAGLPLLNSIKGDTTRIIKEYNCGFTINDENIGDVVTKIVSMNLHDLVQMRANTRLAFEKNFSKDVIRNQIDFYLSPILGDSYEI